MKQFINSKMKDFSYDKMKKNLKDKFPKTKKRSKKSNFKTSDVVVIVLITVFISVFMGAFSLMLFQDIFPVYKVNNNELSPKMKEFIKNYNYIKDNYYGNVDENTLLDSAISGILESLNDPYSTTLDQYEAKRFDILLDGSYEGIGLEISNDAQGNIIVLNIFKNSPADYADIEIGDIILSIDNISLVGKTSTYFGDYVFESNKTKFDLEISRNGVKKNLTIAKKLIIINSVTDKIIEKGTKKIGYIRVDLFSATTYNQFKTSLEKLEKANITSLIIDLRDNSGGHLSVVQDILSLFLNSRHIVYQIEGKDGVNKVYSSGTKDKTYPIVFLGNKDTASASELMIGALRDELGAKLIGETTFGKGTVQKLITLSDGSSYKFTTERWLTPKGTWIHQVGIAPDIKVEVSDEYIKNPIESNDSQYQKAIEYLSK